MVIKIDVSSTISNVECDYESGTPICIIGLSISDKLVFNENNLDIYVDQAKELINDILNNENKLLLAKINNIYKSEECCICMSDEEEPDTICIHVVINVSTMDVVRMNWVTNVLYVGPW